MLEYWNCNWFWRCQLISKARSIGPVCAMNWIFRSNNEEKWFSQEVGNLSWWRLCDLIVTFRSFLSCILIEKKKVLFMTDFLSGKKCNCIPSEFPKGLSGDQLGVCLLSSQVTNFYKVVGPKKNMGLALRRIFRIKEQLCAWQLKSFYCSSRETGAYLGYPVMTVKTKSWAQQNLVKVLQNIAVLKTYKTALIMHSFQFTSKCGSQALALKKIGWIFSQSTIKKV